MAGQSNQAIQKKIRQQREKNSRQEKEKVAENSKVRKTERKSSPEADFESQTKPFDSSAHPLP